MAQAGAFSRSARWPGSAQASGKYARLGLNMMGVVAPLSSRAMEMEGLKVVVHEEAFLSILVDCFGQ
jgi:hypothetical protein